MQNLLKHEKVLSGNVFLQLIMMKWKDLHGLMHEQHTITIETILGSSGSMPNCNKGGFNRIAGS